MIARLLFYPFAAVLLLLGSACGHYQLGTTAAPVFASLHIAPVASTPLVPQARPIVSAQLRDAFIRDGRVSLASDEARADATLLLTLTDYHREVATVRPGDTGLARKFEVTLAAEITLRDNRTGAELFSRRPVTVKRDLFTDGGQLQAEYQLLPLLAADLAEKARHAALDVW